MSCTSGCPGGEFLRLRSTYLPPLSLAIMILKQALVIGHAVLSIDESALRELVSYLLSRFMCSCSEFWELPCRPVRSRDWPLLNFTQKRTHPHCLAAVGRISWALVACMSLAVVGVTILKAGQMIRRLSRTGQKTCPKDEGNAGFDWGGRGSFNAKQFELAAKIQIASRQDLKFNSLHLFDKDSATLPSAFCPVVNV